MPTSEKDKIRITRQIKALENISVARGNSQKEEENAKNRIAILKNSYPDLYSAKYIISVDTAYVAEFKTKHKNDPKFIQFNAFCQSLGFKMMREIDDYTIQWKKDDFRVKIERFDTSLPYFEGIDAIKWSIILYNKSASRNILIKSAYTPFEDFKIHLLKAMNTSI